MKLAVTGILKADDKAPFVFRGPFEEIIPKAARVGFNAMELHIHDSSKIDREALKKLFKENNISLSSIGTGSAYSVDHISLSSEVPEIRNQAVKRIQEHIITAKDYQAVVIIGLIKGLVKDSSSKEVFLENLTLSLNECIKTAEEHKVVMAFEMINRYESDFLNTIEEGLNFIKGFNSDYLQLHIDTYHMNIEETSIAENIRKAKGKIAHCHIADSDRWYAGHGHYDFKETIKVLQEIGYQGVLSIESFMFPDSELSAQYSYQYLKRILDDIREAN